MCSKERIAVAIVRTLDGQSSRSRLTHMWERKGADMSIASLLRSEDDISLEMLSKSDRMHHDWQAVRIIREGYASTWTLIMTYFTWFNLTMLGAVAFLVKGDMSKSLLMVASSVGCTVLILQIFVFLFLRKIPQLVRNRIDAVISKGEVIDKIVINGHIVIPKSGEIVISVMIAVMCIDTTGWIYMSYLLLTR